MGKRIDDDLIQLAATSRDGIWNVPPRFSIHASFLTSDN
jgi:hypothetical protein